MALTDKNFIKTTWSENGKQVRVQIWIDGEPGSWLLYNLEQLDDLIELLRVCRSKLAEKLEIQ